MNVGAFAAVLNMITAIRCRQMIDEEEEEKKYIETVERKFKEATCAFEINSNMSREEVRNALNKMMMEETIRILGKEDEQ